MENETEYDFGEAEFGGPGIDTGEGWGYGMGFISCDYFDATGTGFGWGDADDFFDDNGFGGVTGQPLTGDNHETGR